MRSLLPATAENPFAQVLDLTGSLPAEILAVSVGAFVGVGLFIVMMIAFSRRNRPLHQFHSANDLVFIPPYPTHSRPPPPRSIARPPPQPVVVAHQPFDPGFTPSSALSARAFQKMGYELVYGPDAGAPQHQPVPRRLDSEEEELASGELCVVGGTSPMPTLTQLVAEVAAAPKSVPEPLRSVECVFDPPSMSSLETGPASVVSVRVAAADPNLDDNNNDNEPKSISMRAASIAELDLDDAPTHLREPLFEEPPQPRRRTTPPKIRKVDPAPPRPYRPYQPYPQESAALPPITPPPTQPQPIWRPF